MKDSLLSRGWKFIKNNVDFDLILIMSPVVTLIAGTIFGILINDSPQDQLSIWLTLIAIILACSYPAFYRRYMHILKNLEGKFLSLENKFSSIEDVDIEYVDWESHDSLLFYTKIGEVINNANKSIYALSTESIMRMADRLSENQPERARIRRLYYKQLADKVTKMYDEDREFTYIRILQRTEASTNSIEDSHGQTIAGHIRTILEKESSKRNSAKPWRCEIFPLISAFTYGFVVVDEEILVLIFDRLDKDGYPMHTGALIIKSQSQVPFFTKVFFNTLTTHNPQKLSLDDLKNSLPIDEWIKKKDEEKKSSGEKPQADEVKPLLSWRG